MLRVAVALAAQLFHAFHPKAGDIHPEKPETDGSTKGIAFLNELAREKRWIR